MAGKIQAQFDLLSNSSGAEASVKRYAEQLKAANAVLAQAERVAKESYQSQSLSAKAAGASAEALTKIQQEYFQSLVAIRNAAKDTGAQLVQSNTGSVSSENAKTEAIRLATSAIQQQTIAVKANAAAQASAHSISNQSAASGAVQLLDGRSGIRTVENFLGNTLGLGGVFGALFPVIGAIQAGKLLLDLGEKVYDVGQKASQAGSKLEETMEAAHSKSQLTIADLTIQADKIQDNIDKLSGHPSNGLRTAIDEARKSSIEFNQSLIENRKQVLALFKEYSISAAGGWLGDKTPTSNQEKSIDAQMKRMQSESQKINSDIDSRIAKASSLDQRDSLEKERQSRQNTLVGGYVGEWRKERQDAVNGNLVTDVDAKTGRVSYRKTDQNSGRIGDLDLAINSTQSGMDEYNARMKVADLTKQELALKGQKESSTLSKEANAKALAAQKKHLEDQKKFWDEMHADWEAAGDRTAADEADFYLKAASTMQEGSDEYRQELEKASEAIRQTRRNTLTLSKENDKILAGMGQEFDAESLKKQEAGIESQAKATNTFISALGALADAQTAARLAAAQASIQYGVADGSLSKYDAAVLTQTLHTQTYLDELSKLQDKLASIQGTGSAASAQRTQLQTQITQLDSQRALQTIQDQASVAANTIGGALRNVNDQWLAETKDTAKQVADLYRSAVEGLNNDLTNTLMKVGERGQHHLGRQLGNAVGGTLRSGAGQLANYGLKTAESALPGGFGLAGKPDGTRSNPWFVQMAGIGSVGDNPFTGDLASKLGFGSTGKDSSNSGSFGILSSVFGGIFGGGKAVGGPVNAGMTYLVGENGPELFNPGASGNITPNNKLNGMMGTTYLHMPVDARGATNPAEVEAAANRAVSRAAPQIVAASLRAHSEQQNRKPYSQRP